MNMQGFHYESRLQSTEHYNVTHLFSIFTKINGTVNDPHSHSKRIPHTIYINRDNNKRTSNGNFLIRENYMFQDNVNQIKSLLYRCSCITTTKISVGASTRSRTKIVIINTENIQ